MDEPLTYWTAVARMGFENDLHRLFNEMGISRVELAKRVGASPAYVSKVLNGVAGNYQLETMAKWARAIGAIVQVRLIKEGREAVRVVNYETASALDDLMSKEGSPQESRTELEGASSPQLHSNTERSSVLLFDAYRQSHSPRVAAPGSNIATASELRQG